MAQMLRRSQVDAIDIIDDIEPRTKAEVSGMSKRAEVSGMSKRAEVSGMWEKAIGFRDWDKWD